MTLYAVWVPVYTIVFHRNDASDDSVEAYAFDYGVSTRLPSLAKLGWARRGIAFLGWATSLANAAAGKVWKKDWSVVATAAAAGRTLDVYAVWALKPGFYQIRFNKNDGTGKWRSLGYGYGVSMNLSTVKALDWTVSGKAFKGWATSETNAADSKVWKTDGAVVSTAAAEGKTLSIYAVWE